ncbi:MAG: DUF167 domain-containing protein [Lautropia sp.]
MEITVKVRPGARASTLVRSDDGSYLAQVKAQPVDGKANDELIALIAAHFGCRRADVTIHRGASGRLKRVRIASD